METIHNICPHCNKEYTTTNKRKIYCCRRCKQNASAVRNYGSRMNSNDKKKYLLYKEIKTNVCCVCGFIADDLSQIDIHHRDGNHHNNTTDNLVSVCANCHRLIHSKSIINIFIPGRGALKYN